MPETKGYIRTADEKGSVNIGQNVVTTIAAAAAADVDGVYGLYQSPGKELTDVAGKKGISKGAKVTLDGDEIKVDIFLIAELGSNVSEVAEIVQKSVKTAIEGSIGRTVNDVNVNICGIAQKRVKQDDSVIRSHVKPAGQI